MLTRSVQNSASSSTVYFVDVYSSNEGEVEYSLEYAALSFSKGSEERPEVYIHTFLKPTISLNKFRWPVIYSEAGISKEKIEDGEKYPTLDEMLSCDYLTKRHIVCFDDGIDPINRIVSSASEYDCIKRMWEVIFRDNEKAIACTTLDEMCNFIGVLEENKNNTNYTPLLKKLYKMASLWDFLTDCLNNPKLKRNISSGSMQMSLIWPLPDTKTQWFDTPCTSFADVTQDMVNQLFDSTLSDRINWFEMGMYANDWEFSRSNVFASKYLSGVNDLASFIFTKVLSFDVQLWVLILYALYQHKTEVAKKVALAKGDFSVLNSVNKDHLSLFIIDNLDVFLNPAQKKKLISSLVRQSFKAKSEKNFEKFDFYKLKKNAQKNKNSQVFYFPEDDKEANYIRDDRGHILYVGFEVKGRAKDRAYTSDLAVNNIQKFYAMVSNVFSDVWINQELKLWLEFITGISYADISREQRFNDSEELTEVRNILRELLQKEAVPYLRDLFNYLQDCVNVIRKRSEDPFDKCFVFQDISIECKINPPAKLGLLSRIFSFS